MQVGTVELAGPFTAPDEVSRSVVPVAGERVPAGHGLLVAEDEGLVAGVEVDLVQALLRAEVDPARRHEPQGPVDLGGDGLVALALPARGDELLVPHVDLGQVGEPALGERTEQVERRRRLVVGRDQTGWGPAGGPPAWERRR